MVIEGFGLGPYLLDEAASEKLMDKIAYKPHKHDIIFSVIE